VITGAFAAATGLVELDSAIQAMADSMPSYRRQHIDTNATALTRGFESVERLSVPAWQEVAA
jgi:2-oxoglutarate ferredoxin oxidoreductase subunit gamma